MSDVLLSQHTIVAAAGEAQVIIHPPIEHLQDSWRKGHFFEPEMLDYIGEHYQGGTFIDVGSAIGNHTLYFSLFCNPDLVISIEPVAEQVERQIELLTLNNVLDKVRILNTALSDAKGTCDMEHFAGSWGQFRIKKGEGEIPVDTLDNVIESLGISNISLIKIDVEQHEIPVLRGAVKTLARESPGLFIEIVARPMRPFEDFLSQFSYTRVSERFISANAYEFRKQ